MNHTLSDTSRNSLLNAVLATVSVIAVTYLTKRRERPIEAVFDAGMDYERRLTRRAAATV
jgi:hypothetical protein